MINAKNKMKRQLCVWQLVRCHGQCMTSRSVRAANQSLRMEFDLMLRHQGEEKTSLIYRFFFQRNGYSLIYPKHDSNQLLGYFAFAWTELKTNSSNTKSNILKVYLQYYSAFNRSTWKCNIIPSLSFSFSQAFHLCILSAWYHICL